ncbi:hypothetical protein PsorP6_014541 [Peronosclerospora sorghi]|uniref:Uncharacterized protein n=1 Tax=Peronosclerospora sorghi TaxID=230839 RepID=A0ACC0VT94_9STRA|nr:hypothetical protein PsorP6_014541 [Peronosclerospora sorghi]
MIKYLLEAMPKKIRHFKNPAYLTNYLFEREITISSCKSSSRITPTLRPPASAFRNKEWIRRTGKKMPLCGRLRQNIAHDRVVAVGCMRNQVPTHISCTDSASSY